MRQDNTDDAMNWNEVPINEGESKGSERRELGRTVELDVWDRPGLEPALEGNDGGDPSDGETRDCNGQTRDHHDIVPFLPHCGHSQLRGAEHEH